MVRVSSRRFPQATTARCMTSSARLRLVIGRAKLLSKQKENQRQKRTHLGTEEETKYSKVHELNIEIH